MSLHAFIVSRRPNWDTLPEALRREMLPQFEREYADMKTGAIGRAKWKFLHEAGHRVWPKQTLWDMMIKALQDEGVIK